MKVWIVDIICDGERSVTTHSKEALARAHIIEFIRSDLNTRKHSYDFKVKLETMLLDDMMPIEDINEVWGGPGISVNAYADIYETVLDGEGHWE